MKSIQHRFWTGLSKIFSILILIYFFHPQNSHAVMAIPDNRFIEQTPERAALYKTYYETFFGAKFLGESVFVHQFTPWDSSAYRVQIVRFCADNTAKFCPTLFLHQEADKFTIRGGAYLPALTSYVDHARPFCDDCGLAYTLIFYIDESTSFTAVLISDRFVLF